MQICYLLSANTIYIFDEASMISNVEQNGEFILFGTGHLLDDLIRFVNIDNNNHNKKIIFVGDSAQLPPVKMSFSPALDTNYLEKKYGLKSQEYELQEIVRQKAESGIVKNSLNLRNALKVSKFYKLDMDVSFPDTVPLKYGDVVSTYLATGKSGMFNNSIMIVSTNSDATRYNEDVRKELFPDCKCVTVGDKLLAVRNAYIGGQLLFNGDFVFVKSCENNIETRKVPVKDKGETTIWELTFRKIVIEFVDAEGKNVEISTYIIEDLLYSYDKTLSSEEEKALFIDFCIRHPKLKLNSAEFQDAIRSDPYFNALRVKFGYVITCHKAQGSEWENVFIKCKTYHKSVLTSDYFRWLYTALTRATSVLFLLEAPHKKIGSGIWNVRAFAWCLIDLCKQASKDNNIEELKKYLANLDNLTIADNKENEILLKQITFVNNLEDYKKSQQAKVLSKSGQHGEAIKMCYELLKDKPHDVQISNSVGWELYHIISKELANNKPDEIKIKKLLNDYLKLKTEKPSSLHSGILRHALKLKKISVLNFLNLWGISNFRKVILSNIVQKTLRKNSPILWKKRFYLQLRKRLNCQILNH